MRLRIDLAYDGGDFNGWATQPGLRTVQAEVTAALATSLRVPADGGPEGTDRVRVVCAGRTDTGVHARGQVCHVDLAPERVERAAPQGPHRLVRRLNGILPADIRVRRVATAPHGFDARFSALWRRYTYRVADAPVLLDPLTRGHVLTSPRELDTTAMDAAARVLVGRHDFASFCRKRAGATTIRTLLDLDVGREPGGLVEFRVRADAFCHSMVRSLVGSLIAVGEDRQAGSFPAELLELRRRDPRLSVAPARGLTLEEVAYPDDDALAERAEQTRARRTLEDVEDRTHPGDPAR